MTNCGAFWIVIAGLAAGCVGAIVHAVAPQAVGFGVAGFIVVVVLLSS